MCGITAYLGNNNAEKNLIESLKLLEYRGYDSAGIAVLGTNIKVTKSAGNISNLEKMLNMNANSTCGIAHTRWATHGVPNNQNAHPHLSNDKKWAVVHNGIIENFEVIKQDLKQKGYKFKSQTDTEVICNLLQDINNKDAMSTLIESTHKLVGSYALCCLHKENKDTLFLAKNKSPLFIAKGDSQVFVASDISCFVNKANEYYCLEDNEYCQADLKNITFYDKNGKKIKKMPQKLDNLEISNSKAQYPHYMIKEIMEVPNVLKRLVSRYANDNLLEKYDKDFISNFNKIVLIGCGTAYHASLMGAKYITKFTRIDASAHIASEYRYSNPLVDTKTLCILVSQSGETADTLAVCDLVKKRGATTIALTNVLYSTLAHKTKYVLPVCAGTEIAVASTKAYSAQISILYMFAKHLQNVLFGLNYDYLSNIQSISNKIKIPTKRELNSILNELSNKNKPEKDVKHVFFIGRDLDFVSALEASLKLKEITYIFSVEHPAGELKHGFLALIEKGSIVFAIATNNKLLDKTLNGAFEAQSRGAKVIFVTQFDLPTETTKKFFKFIKLNSVNEDLMPITSISFFQMLAYALSVRKEYNPDQPRNLAKSVTVE